MRCRYRAILELLALASGAWFLSILIEPDPPWTNVYRWGAQWFVGTFAMSTTIAVLPPLILVFGIGSMWRWMVARNVTYWQIYRVAYVVAVIWAALANYGHWYADCRQAHDVASCQL